VLGGLSERLAIPPDQLIAMQRTFFDKRTSPGAAISSDWVIAETNAWIAANPESGAPEVKPIRRFAISVYGPERSIEVWTLVRAELRQTAIHTNGNAFNPALSADGVKVAFISDRSSSGKNWLYVHDLITDQDRLLTADLENAGDPAWSPHGSLIAFVTTRDGADQIYLVDADGGIARPLNNSDARGRVPTWSPDGSQLAFVSDRSGRDLVYIATPSSGEVYTLPAPDNRAEPINSLAWSPNGRYLALAVGAERLWIFDLQVAIRPYEVYQASYGIDTVAWSDDGGLLLLALQDRQGSYAIWIANIPQGDNNQLALAEPDLLIGGADGESLSDPSWQPRAR
jgi:TolB protein